MRAGLCLALALLTAGCSNFDFSTVRTANGGYDRAKLVAALEASPSKSLFSFSWFPLIYMNLTVFNRNSTKNAEGHVLGEVSGYGPLFLVNEAKTKLTTFDGEPIEETAERTWGWGLARTLYERVETKNASRVVNEGRWVFGLFGGRKIRRENDEGS